MKMLIQSLSQQVRKVTPEFEAEFAALLEVANQALGQTRGLARSYCPIDLTDDGLVLALRLLAQTVTDVFRIPCDFTCSSDLPLADERWATHLYYICNEAVTNAFKHARAEHIYIRLMQQHHTLVLEVEDDGVGISAEGPATSSGMGIRTMQYRASAIEAALSTSKATECGGTLVRCLLPLR